MKRERPRRKVLAHRGDSAVKVGMLLVELVDDDKPRLARSVAEFPCDLGADRQLAARALSWNGSRGEEHGVGQGRLAVVRVAEQDHVPDLFSRVICGHPTPI